MWIFLSSIYEAETKIEKATDIKQEAVLCYGKLNISGLELLVEENTKLSYLGLIHLVEYMITNKSIKKIHQKIENESN